MSELPASVLLSLRVALIATVIATVVAVPAAFATARKRGLWLGIIETLITLPVVLPPTVVGFGLLMLLGVHGPVGAIAIKLTGSSLLFTETAAIIAAASVALPLVYLPTKVAFAAIDPDLETSARLWGATTRVVFFQISLPLAIRGVAAGVVLGFARALGEFGATVMLIGISDDLRTLPIAIYLQVQHGDVSAAWPAVAVLAAISTITVAIVSRFSR